MVARGTELVLHNSAELHHLPGVKREPKKTCQALSATQYSPMFVIFNIYEGHFAAAAERHTTEPSLRSPISTDSTVPGYGPRTNRSIVSSFPTTRQPTQFVVIELELRGMGCACIPRRNAQKATTAASPAGFKDFVFIPQRHPRARFLRTNSMRVSKPFAWRKSAKP